MSRSGYSDGCWGDFNEWAAIRWRGAIMSALRGRRGQAFLRELLGALDALPAPRLVANELMRPDGEVCVLGAVAKARRLDVGEVDPEDNESVATMFGIANALAREFMYENDEGTWGVEAPEARFVRVRAWVQDQIKETVP